MDGAKEALTELLRQPTLVSRLADTILEHSLRMKPPLKGEWGGRLTRTHPPHGAIPRAVGVQQHAPSTTADGLYAITCPIRHPSREQLQRILRSWRGGLSGRGRRSSG